MSEVHCHSIFDEALEKVSGVDIWSHYADTCLERLELDGSDDLNSRVINLSYIMSQVMNDSASLYVKE